MIAPPVLAEDRRVDVGVEVGGAHLADGDGSASGKPNVVFPGQAILEVHESPGGGIGMVSPFRAFGFQGGADAVGPCLPLGPAIFGGQGTVVEEMFVDPVRESDGVFGVGSEPVVNVGGTVCGPAPAMSDGVDIEVSG